MAEYNSKWQKSFEKKYSKAITQLQELENEFKQMVKDNPDSWVAAFPESSVVELSKLDGWYCVYNKPNENENNPQEHGELTFNTQVGSFVIRVESLEQLFRLRTDIIELADKFGRPTEPVKELLTDDCEDEEGWEDNEYSEYTVQASRTCTQTWTHTVQARSNCEAYRLVNEDDDGSTHDQNDDYVDYGDIDYEVI